MKSFEIGEIVKSIAGRDKNSYYVVAKITNDNYVKLVNGDRRKFSNLKKKNIKHLKKVGYVAEELIFWLKNGKRVRNEDIKLALKDYEEIRRHK